MTPELAAQIKTMLGKGLQQRQVAAALKIDQGRASEVSTGKIFPKYLQRNNYRSISDSGNVPGGHVRCAEPNTLTVIVARDNSIPFTDAASGITQSHVLSNIKNSPISVPNSRPRAVPFCSPLYTRWRASWLAQFAFASLKSRDRLRRAQ